MSVLQSENLSHSTRPRTLPDLHLLTFPEMIAPAIGSKLLHLSRKFVAEQTIPEVVIEACCKRSLSVVMADMKGVFAAFRPVRGNSQLLTDCPGCAFQQQLSAEGFPDMPGLRSTLPAPTGSRGSPFADGLNQSPTHSPIRNRFCRNTQLQQTH
jgi:hypothetical protein